MQRQQSSHFGVYCLICQDRQVLLVRKTRGPYAGLLDLPGGMPDPSDLDRAATLKREIAEETGLLLTGNGPWYELELRVTRDSSGRAIDLVHSGAWAVATVAVPASWSPVLDIASSDTAGLAWIDTADWRNRRDLSMLVQVVLASAEERGLVGSPPGA